MRPFLYKRKIILTHQINDRDIIMSLLEAINKNKITEIDSLLSLYNADVTTCISILDHIRSCTDKRVTNYTYKKILRDLSSDDISRILSYLLEKERYLQVILTIRNCRDYNIEDILSVINKKVLPNEVIAESLFRLKRDIPYEDFVHICDQTKKKYRNRYYLSILISGL